MECQILGKDRWKSRAKTGKTATFPGKSGTIIPICPVRIETPFLHILDPNYPSFCLKCPRKYKKSYNFDIFQQFTSSHLFPAQISGKILNLIISPYVYIIEVRLYPFSAKQFRTHTLYRWGGGGGRGTISPTTSRTLHS